MGNSVEAKTPVSEMEQKEFAIVKAIQYHFPNAASLFPMDLVHLIIVYSEVTQLTTTYNAFWDPNIERCSDDFRVYDYDARQLRLDLYKSNTRKKKSNFDKLVAKPHFARVSEAIPINHKSVLIKIHFFAYAMTGGTTFGNAMAMRPINGNYRIGIISNGYLNGRIYRNQFEIKSKGNKAFFGDYFGKGGFIGLHSKVNDKDFGLFTTGKRLTTDQTNEGVSSEFEIDHFLPKMSPIMWNEDIKITVNMVNRVIIFRRLQCLDERCKPIKISFSIPYSRFEGERWFPCIVAHCSSDIKCSLGVQLSIN